MTHVSNHPQALYIHVPFCRTICAYCDFCHTVYREQSAQDWLSALERELSQRKLPSDYLTAYIGGGTPTALSAEQLERLLTLLDPYVQHVHEYTVEVNPETLDEKKAEILAEHGINRASIGFQTSDPGLLKLMNRHHSYEDIALAIQLLRSKGIMNISLDLMYSLPGQTMAMLRQSVEDALSLNPQHLSLYSLTIEENTVFGRKGYEHLDEDTEADMYEWICSTLEQHGYIHYEISNFCMDGYASRHNQAYWHYEDFTGVSCGASGKEGNIRYDNTRSLKEYCADPLHREELELSDEDLMFEFVMMGLRLKEGFHQSVFQERYAVSYKEVYGEKTEELIHKGLLEECGDMIRCTDRGFEILNSVLVELL